MGALSIAEASDDGGQEENQGDAPESILHFTATWFDTAERCMRRPWLGINLLPRCLYRIADKCRDRYNDRNHLAASQYLRVGHHVPVISDRRRATATNENPYYKFCGV